MEKVKKAIRNPKSILIFLVIKMSYLFSDALYLKLLYKLKFDRKLDLKSPKTFNEKLNWLKLNDHNPRYTIMADKYLVKDYVASIIGEEYVVPCYGVWDSVDDIKIKTLPKKFVLKANHDSSGAYIVKNGIIPEYVKEKYRKLLKRNYFYFRREWVYKNISPKILAEECLIGEDGEIIKDYKFLCFNGIPRLMYCTNKSTNIFENYYDMDFNPVNIRHGFRRQVPEFEKPEKFDLMKELAAKLSKDIPVVRVDFFYIDNKVYFAEYTFYDWAGLRPFDDYEWDKKLGEWIVLPNKL